MGEVLAQFAFLAAGDKNRRGRSPVIGTDGWNPVEVRIGIANIRHFLRSNVIDRQVLIMST